MTSKSKMWIVGKCKSTGKILTPKTVHDAQIECTAGWVKLIAYNRESAVHKFEELLKQAKKK